MKCSTMIMMRFLSKRQITRHVHFTGAFYDVNIFLYMKRHYVYATEFCDVFCHCYDATFLKQAFCPAESDFYSKQ